MLTYRMSHLFLDLDLDHILLGPDVGVIDRRRSASMGSDHVPVSVFSPFQSLKANSPFSTLQSMPKYPAATTPA